MKDYGKLMLAIVGIAVIGNTVNTVLKYKLFKEAIKTEIK